MQQERSLVMRKERDLGKLNGRPSLPGICSNKTQSQARNKFDLKRSDQSPSTCRKKFFEMVSLECSRSLYLLLSEEEIADGELSNPIRLTRFSEHS